MDQTLQERLQLVLEQQRAAFRTDMAPSREVRLDRLERVRRMTAQHSEALVKAISADFGHRARQETLLADIFTVASAAKHAQKHLRDWMRPRRQPTALHFLPASNRLMRQPLGVVGVVAPWNYPYYLALGPAVGALAAGNRVMIKPSELTPRTGELMAAMVAEFFAPEEMTVLNGEAELARAFTALPFDHLCFTGSTPVGRIVAQAAAQNLTPVTLELGGKSPALIDRSCDLKLTASRIAHGKLFNAGQTCVAPDYLLVPKDLVEPLVQEIKLAMRRLYPRLGGNPDYTHIATPRHLARLRGLLDDARNKGAKLIPSHEEKPGGRALVPHLLLGVNEQMTVMQEEIFGPLLPIVPYVEVDHALAYIKRHDKPLALYWFGRDAAMREHVLSQTQAGGVTVNDCIWHLGQEEQPFGGVGASGMGAYHGEFGFRNFSKEKPVFHQARWAGTRLFFPPYGKTFDRLLGVLKKIA